MTVAFELAPDYAEPLVAWRTWRVVEREGRLSLGSIVKTTIWPADRALVATCLGRRLRRPWRRNQHEAPHMTCECGIYGTTLEEALLYLRDPIPWDSVARVLGRVSLWGEVVECERGYRASHAYPAALYVPLDATCRGGPAAETVARELAAYDATIESIPARWRDAPAVLTSGALRNWS